ncbi:MAG: type I methionyl aminopeptidase [Phycisphaerales bacterium]|nr:type I methionyl aminopeptidase [Phycisphaerales bacterium]
MLVATPEDIQGATRAAECVVRTHERLVEWLKPGQTLAEIDDFVAACLDDLGARSAFIGYRSRPHPAFPSHACLSLNECVVHGTHDMSTVPTTEGDILSIDIGSLLDGWIGDAAWTYAIGGAEQLGLDLMDAGKNSLRLGIEAMQPGRPLLDWARTVHDYVEKDRGFKLIRGLGGHGYGRKLHGPPFISNVMPKHPGEWPDAFTTFKPGLLVAVEPMLSVSTSDISSHRKTWPIYTDDGSLSVHYESDILITENGPLNLTADLFNLPDIVGT